MYVLALQIYNEVRASDRVASLSRLYADVQSGWNILSFYLDNCPVRYA
jgi:hypothetical protein